MPADTRGDGVRRTARAESSPMHVHAVLLDLTHHLVLTDGAPFTAQVPDGARALAALESAASQRIGRALGVALGHRLEGDHAWFVFVDTAWPGERVPLRSWAPANATPWALYRDAMLGGWQPPTTALDVFYFGNEPRLASQLAHHVVKGTKRATTGWTAVAAHDGWALPRPGLVSIVTDGFGIPLCAIETTRVDHGRFGDAGPEIATAEAEGDGSFADWQAAHQRYFATESARIGVPFSDDAELCYEYFRVLRVFQRA
jgi:uncharacterized protein YhfF